MNGSNKANSINQHLFGNQKTNINPDALPPTATCDLSSSDTVLLGHLQRLGWSKLQGLDNVYIETHINGGGTIVHVFLDVFVKMKEAETKREFAAKVIKEIFAEDKDGYARHCFGIIHEGVKHMADLLRYIGEQRYPNTNVVREELGESTSCMCSLQEYVSLVDDTMDSGIHKAGSLRPISLVGTVNEEKGGFYEDVLNALASNTFINMTLPWGDLSSHSSSHPTSSDDGPILWVRPGEQIDPCRDKNESYNSSDSTVNINNSNNGFVSIVRRGRPVREKVVLDRTCVHADFSGRGYDRMPVAAVGLIQATDAMYSRRVCKNVVAFMARCMEKVGETLNLDFSQEPADQALDKKYWVEAGRLNQLRQEKGVGYIETVLRDGDLYYVPRKVIHQFQTVSGCTSIAWHFRYKDYKDFMTSDSSNNDINVKSEPKPNSSN